MVERRRPTSTTMVAWGFVAAQFALIGLMVFGPRDDGFAVSGVFGLMALALMIVGAALGLWSAIYLGRGLTPSPLPNGSVQLVVAGPYRWVRHPMYGAVMLFMAGVAVRSGSWLVVVALVALVVLFNVKARWEEAHLREAFPGYERYTQQTPRFLPNLGSNPNAVQSAARQPAKSKQER